MKYEELRKLFQEHEKVKNCNFVERPPLIHEGFPGTFNLSFTEYEWLKEYGKYVDFDHDYTYSTIPSCIRVNDFENMNGNDSWKYLGVFEMADLLGIINLKDHKETENLHRRHITEMVNFLEELGIKKEIIYPSYNAGGKISDITAGKYKFDMVVPEDQTSKNTFLEVGIPEKNLVPDRTRDTYLALHLHRPTPWGYRNEINVAVKGKLLDIGTLEYSAWTPVFDGEEISEKITGIKKSSSVSLCVFGLERLNVAINNLNSVQDVDYIKPVYDSARLDFQNKMLAVESIRSLHRIYSDIQRYDLSLSRHHKEKIAKMLKNIPTSSTLESLENTLKVHAENQPWQPELEEGIAPTIERIKQYKKTEVLTNKQIIKE